jgi:hypothetical protein
MVRVGGEERSSLRSLFSGHPLVCEHRGMGEALRAEGVLERWNQRYLVYLLGKVL